MRTLSNEGKNKLHKLLGQWSLDDNKYITSCQCFFSRNLHTLYYRDNEKRHKYKQSSSRARRHIEFQKYTKSKFQHPYHLQVCIISLVSSTPTNLRKEANRTDFPPEPSKPPLDSVKEVYTGSARNARISGN